ncbi:hypothetical protein [Luteimonas sp. e5]
MSSQQRLVDQLFAFSANDERGSQEAARIDEMVYRGLMETYAEDERLEASIAAMPPMQAVAAAPAPKPRLRVDHDFMREDLSLAV